MIREPFVVLDMNACRSETLVRPLLDAYDRERTEIYIPGIANWELTKGSTGTLAASMQILAERPDAVTVAWHSRVIKRREQQFKGRIVVVDRRQTRAIRGVLRGLEADTHVPDPATITAVRDFWKGNVDAEEDAKILRQLETLHRNGLENAAANTIRRALQSEPPDRGPFRAHLAQAIGGLEGMERFLIRWTTGT